MVSLLFASKSLNCIYAFCLLSVVKMGGFILTKRLAFLLPTLAGGKFSCVKPSANAFLLGNAITTIEKTRTEAKAKAKIFCLPVCTQITWFAAYLILNDMLQ